MDNYAEMFPAQHESEITQITGVLTAVSVSIPVANAAALPDAPNIATIYDRFGTARETVQYRGKSGSALTAVTRGFYGTTAQPWAAGTEITRGLSGYDIDSIIANVKTLIEAVKTAAPSDVAELTLRVEALEDAIAAIDADAVQAAIDEVTALIAGLPDMTDVARTGDIDAVNARLDDIRTAAASDISEILNSI